MTDESVLRALHKALRMATNVNHPPPALEDRIDSFDLDSLDSLMVIAGCEEFLETFASTDALAQGIETVRDLVAAFKSGTPFGINRSESHGVDPGIEPDPPRWRGC